ncbi:MAG: hypothetical protein O7F69_04845, partial [Alphaproteobacteria bacterium]|nr:hypothetical protein [Alphaproteobacteria bacterium]
MKHLLAAVILFLIAASACAQDSEKGLAAFERGDYATALREWRPLAEQGEARAQHNLGILYVEGKGVRQDFAEGLKW